MVQCNANYFLKNMNFIKIFFILIFQIEITIYQNTIKNESYKYNIILCKHIKIMKIRLFLHIF